jgi:hypothetical protein
MTIGSNRRRGIVVMLALLVAACATPDTTPGPTRPPPVREVPAPPPKPSAPPVAAAPAKPKPEPAPAAEAPKEPARSLGVDELAKGVKSYDDGDYQAASKQFQAALDLGLASPADRAAAHKHLAFIACVHKRARNCRIEFGKALTEYPAFDLTPAEAGHPTWGPVFRSVKAEIAKTKQKAKK